MVADKYDIVLDFDGTCVAYKNPGIGADIGAVPILKELVRNGHRLILCTMRSNKPFTLPSGEIDIHGLDDAVAWFKENEIELYGIQKHPEQEEWTHSPKTYGHIIIDDTALGIPLNMKYWISDKPFVDWTKVEKLLIGRGMI